MHLRSYPRWTMLSRLKSAMDWHWPRLIHSGSDIPVEELPELGFEREIPVEELPELGFEREIPVEELPELGFEREILAEEW